jgi:hypothetical protein
MINELTNIILQKTFEGFKTENEVASSDRFSPQNIENLYNAIKQMFKLLEIEIDLTKLKKINVLYLDRFNFGCVFFLNSCFDGFVYQNECDTRCKATDFAKKNNIDMECVMNLYSKHYACSNINNVLINIDFVPKQIGLHLICHEIMHYLASGDAVKELRKETMGDEAINEFFARLATTIFNSMDVPNNIAISGYTLWNNEDVFNDHSDHSKTLGLYGKLMASEKYFYDEKKYPKYKDVDYVKRLAGFYFLNRSMN